MRDLRSTIAAEADIRLREWLVDDTQLSATEAWSGIANLAAYLALRTHDVRDAQVALADLGLSSLGRCEAHVLPTFDAMIAMLGRALAVEPDREPAPRTSISEASATAHATLQRNSAALFGYPIAGRHPRIMVTLPTEAADEPAYVRSLVEAGMDCGRINCGHDTPEQWIRMAANVRAAAAETGRSCSVLDGPERTALAHRPDRSGPIRRPGPSAPRSVGHGHRARHAHPRCQRRAGIGGRSARCRRPGRSRPGVDRPASKPGTRSR